MRLGLRNAIFSIEPELAALACYNQGLTRRAIGDLDGALKEFSEAIRLKPNELAYHKRGNARDDKGDRDGAVKDYSEAIRIKPDYADSYYNRGLVREKMADYEAAANDFQHYLDLGGGQRDGDQVATEARIRRLNEARIRRLKTQRLRETDAELVRRRRLWLCAAISLQLACAIAAPAALARPLYHSFHFLSWSPLDDARHRFSLASYLGIAVMGLVVIWRSHGTAVASLGLVQGIISLFLVAGVLLIDRQWAEPRGFEGVFGQYILASVAVLSHGCYMLRRLARLHLEAD